MMEWWQLGELAEVCSPDAPLRTRFAVAVDVRNPLLGPSGCTRVYGPQKGLGMEDFDLTEKCLTRLAGVMKKQHDFDGANVPGAGAAGGLGFGLTAFAGARLESGFDLFARVARLEERIRAADLVITGEGAMDEQTRMGKGVGQIAQCCARRGAPCLGFAGAITRSVRQNKLFAHMRELTELAPLPRAQSQAAHLLKQLAEETARNWE